MFQDFQQLSFQVHQALTAQNVKVVAGHVQQILCALLGYNSLAAMQAARHVEQPGVAGADFIICDQPLAASRAKSLGLPEAIAAAIYASLKQVADDQATVFASEAEFVDEEVHHELTMGLELTNVLSGPMAMTNAYGPGWVDVEFVDEPAGLDDGDGAWSIEMSGTLSLHRDPDKVFWGSKIAFEGEIEYPRAGRRLLLADPRITADGRVSDFY
jgi:hypothetical protein